MDISQLMDVLDDRHWDVRLTLKINRHPTTTGALMVRLIGDDGSEEMTDTVNYRSHFPANGFFGMLILPDGPAIIDAFDYNRLVAKVFAVITGYEETGRIVKCLNMIALQASFYKLHNWIRRDVRVLAFGEINYHTCDDGVGGAREICRNKHFTR